MSVSAIMPVTPANWELLEVMLTDASTATIQRSSGAGGVAPVYQSAAFALAPAEPNAVMRSHRQIVRFMVRRLRGRSVTGAVREREPSSLPSQAETFARPPLRRT